MKCTVILMCICVLFSCDVWGQTRLSGNVCAENGDKLSSVVISIYDVREDDAVDFIMTDERGCYDVKVNLPSKYVRVEFALVGYEAVNVEAWNVKWPYDVIMKAETVELKEVVVSAVPVRVRNDTISYDVGSMKEVGDVTIEDVIKRIPGIKVEDSGRILYNGKGISNFYIEGMDLLSGRYALASKNISADDVSSVNVYRNHQHKQVLEDVEMPDGTALDLKLKKNSMLHPIWTASAGGGYGDEGLMLGELSVLLVHPKVQSLNTFKAKNVGGTYRNETEDWTSEYVMDDKTVATSLGKLERLSGDAPIDLYDRSRSAVATTNNLVKMRENVVFGVWGGYETDCVRNDMEEHMVCWNNGNMVFFDEHHVSDYDESRGWLELKWEDNQKGHYFMDNLKARGTFLNGRHDVTAADFVAQRNKVDDYCVKNVLDAVIRVHDNVIRYNGVVSFLSTPKCGLTAVTGDSTFLCQTMDGKAVRMDQNLSMKWQVNKRSWLSAMADFKGTWDNLVIDREKYVLCDGGEYGGYNLTSSLTVGYNTSIGPVSVDLKVPLRANWLSYGVKDDRTNFTRMFPAFNATLTYRYMNMLRCQLMCSSDRGFGGLSNFVPVPISTSYRDETVYGHGVNVERRTMNASSLVTYDDFLNGYNAMLMVSNMWNKRNVVNVGDVDENGIKSSVRKGDNSMNVFTGAFSVTRKFYSWHSNLTLDGSLNVLNTKYVRQSVMGDVHNVQYTLGVAGSKTMFNDFMQVRFEYQYERMNQDVDLFAVHSVQSNHCMTYGMSFYPVRKMEIGGQMVYRMNVPDEGCTNRNVYVNAKMKYSLKQMEFELCGYNLTNKRVYVSDSFSNGDVMSYVYMLKPLEVVFRAKWVF